MFGVYSDDEDEWYENAKKLYEYEDCKHRSSQHYRSAGN